MMENPFHLFVQGIIDYAGLFPPTHLDMDEAIRNYASYRESTEAWMLSRFICPAARLKELETYKSSLFEEGEPFRFSVLAGSDQTIKAYISTFSDDMKRCSDFLAGHEDRLIIDMCETRIPGDVLKGVDSRIFGDFISQVAEIVEQMGPQKLTLYYEPERNRQWKPVVKMVVAEIAEHNSQIAKNENYQRYQPAGFKLRCGGVEPAMFPTSEQIAIAIVNCHKRRIAMKATAGLHHPMRHHNQELQVKMHGFLNLVTAGVMATNNELNQKEIEEILEDEVAANFLFTKRAMAWRNLRASREAIKDVRQHLLVSFGSCSFDDPRADLRALNLL